MQSGSGFLEMEYSNRVHGRMMFASSLSFFFNRFFSFNVLLSKLLMFRTEIRSTTLSVLRKVKFSLP